MIDELLARKRGLEPQSNGAGRPVPPAPPRRPGAAEPAPPPP